MKYKVKIIETLEKVVEIEASTEQDAHDKVENMWIEGEIVLISPDNMTDHEIFIIED